MRKKMKKLLIDDSEIALVTIVALAFFVNLALYSAS